MHIFHKYFVSLHWSKYLGNMNIEDKKLWNEIEKQGENLDTRQLAFLMLRRLAAIEKGGKSIFSLREAAMYMDCSTNHVRDLARGGKIARLKPAIDGGKSGRIYFLRKDLDAYLTTHRIPSIYEVDQEASDYIVSHR